MQVQDLTSAILQQMPKVGKCQRRFIIHIMHLFLRMSGRKNFLMMERYGIYSEQSYRLNFEKDFDFKRFNSHLIVENCGREKLWIFDPSFIAKSGKKTPGVGYFWSGSANAVQWGLELGCLAVADVENHTAFHYHATQTKHIKGEEKLLGYYAGIITKQSEEMKTISPVVCVDAYFSKKSFVDSITASGLTVISRLQKNIYLRYGYRGEQTGKKGRPTIYADKVDTKSLNMDYFKRIGGEGNERIYEGVVHVRSLKQWCTVVVVHTLKGEEITTVSVYFSTDRQMSGLQIYQYYKLRFQIEFLFRDGKHFLGLQECQSRQEKALDFQYNVSLTALNVAKVAHWLSIPKEQRGAFSIADITTRYANKYILDSIITIYGKDPNIEINNPQIKQLYLLGKIAA